MILRRSGRTAVMVVAVAAIGASCTGEGGLNSNFSDQVAVTAGDFDDVAAPLKRMDAAHSVFEGLISTATWDPTFNPDNLDLKVEDLFIASSGSGQLAAHAAVWVGSGTRGF